MIRPIQQSIMEYKELFIFLILSQASFSAVVIQTHCDTYQTDLWQKADGWTNGNPFWNYWDAGHIDFNKSIMSITLDNTPCSSNPAACQNLPYASGEYRTINKYGYGKLSAKLMAVKADGVVSGFFIYNQSPWDEIDVEILGKDPSKVQLNVWRNGQSLFGAGHEPLINLSDYGFVDAHRAYHVYAIDWKPDRITWYINCVEVYSLGTELGPLPSNPGQIMLNFWPGINVDEWLNPFVYKNKLKMKVDWILYETN